MSKEEIIKEFKNLIYNSDFDYIKLMDEDGFTGWHELFENILDLYQKEKEKNRLLIEGKFREVADKNSYIKDNYISKDKIKEFLSDKITYRQFELQQEYRDFEDDIKLNTLQDIKKELLGE